MSINTLRKIRKNLEFINSVKPAKTSPYRSTAEAIIEKYASCDLVNFKTCLSWGDPHVPSGRDLQ